VSTIKIKQVKSLNGANPKQRGTLRSLNLGKIGRVTEKEDNEVVRGMIARVAHLVEVENG
jgi:large subunit ribosomal protein L30